MHAPDFEWDPKKAAANQRKHRVSFEEARTVFEDDEALRFRTPIIRSTKRATSSWD